VSLISVTALTRADEFLRHFAQAARTKARRPRRAPRRKEATVALSSEISAHRT